MDESCLPPSKEPFDFSGSMGISTVSVNGGALHAAGDTITDNVVTVAADSVPAAAATVNDLWAPVTFDAANQADDYKSSSMWWIFFTCFIGGFIALLTPCVWPMIPLTVSFFLKKGKSRRRAVGDALTYGLSIIVIYVLLGW